MLKIINISDEMLNTQKKKIKQYERCDFLFDLEERNPNNASSKSKAYTAKARHESMEQRENVITNKMESRENRKIMK